MGATESGSDVTPEVIALCVDALVIALAQRRLAAEPCEDAMVVAKNSAADPEEGNPRFLSPGMCQTIVCRADDAGQLSWFWAWSGPAHDAPPELECCGPAGHIGDTADLIASVLRLKDSGLESAT